MAIATETILKPDGFTAAVARPEHARGPLPGLLVIQEAWGVDAHIEDVMRRFAAAGYLTLAPDLFAVDGNRPAPLARDRMAELIAFANNGPPNLMGDPAARAAALAKRPEPERGRLGESLAALTSSLSPDRREAQLAIVRAAALYLREEREETRGQMIGSVGFCLGGTLSALLACREPELGAAVIFYGGPPASDEIAKIRCPVLGFYGGKDHRVTSQVPAFVEAMAAAGKRLDHVIYPEAGHAFFNDSRPSYDIAAARDAFARTLIFFRDALT